MPNELPLRQEAILQKERKLVKIEPGPLNKEAWRKKLVVTCGMIIWVGSRSVRILEVETPASSVSN